MGESGQTVVFSMTAEEEEAARLKALLKNIALKTENKGVTLELAETGETIEFPINEIEILNENFARAESIEEKDKESFPNS